MTLRVSPAPRRDIFITMQAAKKGSTTSMVRSTGIPVSIRVVLPLENISMNRAGKALKSTPRPVMKMTAYRMHFQMVMRAISAFRAPRYCPTSVEAAMPMAKPGRKLSDSMRTAILWTPSTPLIGSSLMMERQNIWMPHMPKTSTACGSPIFRMRFCMPMSGRRWEKLRYRGGA